MIKRLWKLYLLLFVLIGLFTLSGCYEAEHHVYAYDSKDCRSVTIPSGLEIVKFDYVVTLSNATLNIEYKKKLGDYNKEKNK